MTQHEQQIMEHCRLDPRLEDEPRPAVVMAADDECLYDAGDSRPSMPAPSSSMPETEPQPTTPTLTHPLRNVVVYVAGPISLGDLADNVAGAHAAGLELVKAGLTALVPHGSVFWGNRLVGGHPITQVSGNSFVVDADYWGTGFLPETIPEGTTYEHWMQCSLVWLARCDVLLRLPGESRGAEREVMHARVCGLPVFYTVAEVIAWATGKAQQQPK